MRLFIGLLPVVFLSGCGSDDGRLEVNGTVKFKGNPIKDGAIVQLSPQEKQGTEGTAVTKNGKFTIPKTSGVKPGKYLVRVTLGDGKTAVNPTDPDAPPGPGGGANILSKELIPKDWNEKSKQEVTVTKDGPNLFDFDIK